MVIKISICKYAHSIYLLFVRYDQREDFTVVVQPLFKGFSIPKLPDGDIDISLFAPDCFHLSTKGHSKHLLKNLFLKHFNTNRNSIHIKCVTRLKCCFYCDII